MLSEILISLRAIVFLTLITCVGYPVLVTAISQLAFPNQANGSLVKSRGMLVGSELLAQKFTDDRYFWPRPSAVDFGTVASGASNQGFTSKKLFEAVAERRAALGQNAPVDLLYASGSGLDPHISPEAARFEATRVAAARRLSQDKVLNLVETFTVKPQLGFLGEPRVNVLMLNLALDKL